MSEEQETKAIIVATLRRYDIAEDIARASAETIVSEVGRMWAPPAHRAFTEVNGLAPQPPEREEGESDEDYGRRRDAWSASIQNARKDAATVGSDPMAKATAVWRS